MNGLRIKSDLMHHRRSKIVISGQVQGVGFRPHVFRTAQKLALSGWVYNTASGVTIEIQGEKVEDFLPELFSKLPVLAQIEQVQTEWIPSCAHEHEFQIKESHFGPIKTTIVPDTGICAACLHELFQTDNRYYGYAFLNCTHCGPRFTITRQLPYDRDQTSMDVFPLCTQCYGDYQNPMDRRYHAQPTACQRCGPQLMQENKWQTPLLQS